MNTPQLRIRKYDEGNFVSSGCSSGQTAEESDDEYHMTQEPSLRYSFLSVLTTPEDSKIGLRSEMMSRSDERNEMMNRIFELELRLLRSNDFIPPSEGDESHVVLLEMEQERSKILGKLKESKIILAMKSLVITDLSSSKEELENELNPLKEKYGEEVTSLKKLLDYKSAEVAARIGECSGLLLANKAIGSKLSNIKRQLEISEENTRIANLKCEENEKELKYLQKELHSRNLDSIRECLGSQFPEKDDSKEFLDDITTSITKCWTDKRSRRAVSNNCDKSNESGKVFSEDGKSNSESDLVLKLQDELLNVIEDLKATKIILKNTEECLNVDNINYRNILEDVKNLNAEMAERSTREDDLQLQLLEVQVELMSSTNELRTRTSELRETREILGKYKQNGSGTSIENSGSDKLRKESVTECSTYGDDQNSRVDYESDCLSIQSGDTMFVAMKSVEYLQVETEIRSLANFLRGDRTLSGLGSNSRINCNSVRIPHNYILDSLSEQTEVELESLADTDTFIGTDKEDGDTGGVRDVFQSLEEVEKFKLQIVELEKKLVDATQLNEGRGKDKSKIIQVIKALQSQRDGLLSELSVMKLQLQVQVVTNNINVKNNHDITVMDANVPLQSEVSVMIKKLKDATILCQETTEQFVVKINDVKKSKLLLDQKMDDKDENEYAIMLLEHYLQLSSIHSGKSKILKMKRLNDQKIKGAEYSMQQSLEIIRTTNAQQKVNDELQYLDKHKKAFKGFIRNKIEQDAQLVELERFLILSNQKTDLINQNNINGIDSDNKNNKINNNNNNNNNDNNNNNNDKNNIKMNFHDFNLTLKKLSVQDLLTDLTERNKIKLINDVEVAKLENDLRIAVENMKIDGEQVINTENYTELQKENLVVVLSELNRELHTKTAELMMLKTTIETNFIDLQRNMRRRNSTVKRNNNSNNNLNNTRNGINGNNGMHSSHDNSSNKTINLNDDIDMKNICEHDYNANGCNKYDYSRVKNDHQIISLENEINELIAFYRLDKKATDTSSSN